MVGVGGVHMCVLSKHNAKQLSAGMLSRILGALSRMLSLRIYHQLECKENTVHKDNAFNDDYTISVVT